MTPGQEFWIALGGGFLGFMSLAAGVYVGRKLLPRLDKPAKPYDPAEVRTDWLKRARGQQ